MKYAAFIRGIMPQNPNTRNARLKAAFEKIGLTDVQPVISSGNVIFSSTSRSTAALEKKIEAVLKTECNFEKDVFVRSQTELEDLIAKDPFKRAEHSKQTYLLVTFLKQTPHEIFTVVDVRTNDPTFMKNLERKYGKSITSRTWKTVNRMVSKMN